MPNNETTPAQEVKEEQTVAEAVAETPVQQEAEEPKEATIAESLGETVPKEEHKLPDSIPYERFKEVNDGRRALEEKVEELTRQLAEKESTKAEVRSELSDIADEYNLDADVLDKVAKTIEARAMERVAEVVAPITKREQQERQNAVFEKMFDTALENNPDFKGVANKDVIRQLAFNPQNANKTLSQIIGEVYGGTVPSPDGKKTMETTTPRGGSNTIEKLDFARAQNDSAYFEQIKSDPDLKAEYDAKSLEEVAKHI